MRLSFLIAGIALAVGIVVALNVFMSDAEPPPATEPITDAAPAPPEPPPPPVAEPELPAIPAEPELVLPALADSDPFVRERIAGATIPEAWLDRGDLLRRAAVVIDNAAGGQLPRRQLAFMAPQGKFPVRTAEETVYLDPAGYLRFNRYVDMLESVPPETLADLLDDAAPLIEQALGELGVKASAESRLIAAIDEVLETPVVAGEILLVQPKVFYEFADPALEELSPLKKQVLRMGPENQARLTSYLTRLRAALAER